MVQGPSVTWQVTGITPHVEATPQDTLITGKQVSFSLSTGYTGKVFVPDSVFGDVNAVKEAVQAQVRAIVAASAITGTVS